MSENIEYKVTLTLVAHVTDTSPDGAIAQDWGSKGLLRLD